MFLEIWQCHTKMCKIVCSVCFYPFCSLSPSSLNSFAIAFRWQEFHHHGDGNEKALLQSRSPKIFGSQGQRTQLIKNLHLNDCCQRLSEKFTRCLLIWARFISDIFLILLGLKGFEFMLLA